MHNPENIEKALSRLMPVALSDGAQADIEKMIDELALAGAKVPAIRALRSRPGGIGAVGVAAAVVLGFVAVFANRGASGIGDESELAIASQISVVTEPVLVYLAESDRVEDVSDEGLHVDSGGSAVRKLRMRVVEESQVRDEESGIVLTLSEPREETYLVPVSNF